MSKIYNAIEKGQDVDYRYFQTLIISTETVIGSKASRTRDSDSTFKNNGQIGEHDQGRTSVTSNRKNLKLQTSTQSIGMNLFIQESAPNKKRMTLIKSKKLSIIDSSAELLTNHELVSSEPYTLPSGVSQARRPKCGPFRILEFTTLADTILAVFAIVLLSADLISYAP
ncbi:hypothetical protein WN51_14284 [Melipona quadrifasciata]|uniref:Uncharacterized protein n=1 Tax=Melipona quadrifasciata TaxID=166423 RepID=A0A0M9A1A1_9HYME|nr:hypothetical protein WN51_14284 [Melipona quadrifasciata]